VAVIIRRADLARDREIIIDVLERHLAPGAGDRRFQWMYLMNPLHEAPQAWLALDSERNAVCGAGAAFPRRFRLGDEEVSAWVLGDFCLDPRYRSVGPALELQRRTLSSFKNSQVEFCYDFPSASMVAVYRRLGFEVSGKMLRLAKPLRVDRKVQQMINNSAAQRVIASFGNALLRFASATAEADESLEVSLHAGVCGEEFSVLAQEQRGRFGICIERSAAYLNWRYVNNPLERHEIVAARRRGRLVGYAVWTQAEHDAAIVDLFGAKDWKMLRFLVAQIAALAEDRGAETLSVSVSEAHPLRSLFSEMGFRVRDSFPVIIIAAQTFERKIDPMLTGWYLMQGDRDS
jgi:hypothetical protein